MKEIVLIVVALFFCGIVNAQQMPSLTNGIWRGVLKRTDGKEIVFNFEVKDSLQKKIMFIINASERLEVDDIVVKKDSAFITLPFFDSEFRVAIQQNRLIGNWIKHLADRDVVIPFEAVYNQTYRFNVVNTGAGINISGRWKAIFTDTVSKKVNENVGVFEQKGNRLTGSFLTPYGDYRYLEGVVDGDSLKLSGFDGGYALLFLAKVNADHTISNGTFYSGAGPATKVWNAGKDPFARLPDAAAATHVKAGMPPRLDFAYKDVNGNMVSIKDERFKNKVVVVQILGSWCPNCIDETRFMREVYREYKSKGVEIVGLAYERTGDFARSQAAVKNFVNRLQVEYPVLIVPVASSDPQLTEKSLPQLERIPAFPTTIFLDRKGEIQTIHAGFSGPATGEEDYEKQKEEYLQVIKRLLAE
ncbi:MAG: TlpA family protein disulfide reductase [Chitinophagaceae bacterium]|nr:TlpA family protein disulfide reductase [Chitinophagaceae bacterium]